MVLYFVLPGEVADGVALDAKGTRLKYPLNGQAKSIQDGAAEVNTESHCRCSPLLCGQV